MRIEFITRAECPLCDTARAKLGRLRDIFSLEIQELDVDSDPELASLYTERVPVARSEQGRVLAEGRWSMLRLAMALARTRLTGR